MLFFLFLKGVEFVSAKEENIIDDDDDTNDRVIYIVG